MRKTRPAAPHSVLLYALISSCASFPAQNSFPAVPVPPRAPGRRTGSGEGNLLTSFPGHAAEADRHWREIPPMPPRRCHMFVLLHSRLYSCSGGPARRPAPGGTGCHELSGKNFSNFAKKGVDFPFFACYTEAVKRKGKQGSKERLQKQFGRRRCPWITKRNPWFVGLTAFAETDSENHPGSAGNASGDHAYMEPRIRSRRSAIPGG